MVEIKNYTFEDFINQLKEEENRLDALLNHIGEDPSNMSVDEKIKRVLEVAYIDLVNNKMEMFMNMTEHQMDDFISFGAQLGLLPPNVRQLAKALEKTNNIRKQFMNQATKYEKNPMKFFETELENFNYFLRYISGFHLEFLQ